MYENKDFEEGAHTELFRVGRDFEWEARTELFRFGRRFRIEISYSFRIGRGSNGAGTAFESVEENRLIYSPQPICELTEHL
jgi:hypothetical protein